jgi:hypothetical protein
LGFKVTHDVDIQIDKDKFLELVRKKNQDIGDFHKEFTQKYGINIRYTTLTNLLDNLTTWKLLYAWYIAKELGVQIEELFVEVSTK